MLCIIARIVNLMCCVVYISPTLLWHEATCILRLPGRPLLVFPLAPVLPQSLTIISLSLGFCPGAVMLIWCGELAEGPDRACCIVVSCVGPERAHRTITWGARCRGAKYHSQRALNSRMVPRLKYLHMQSIVITQSIYRLGALISIRGSDNCPYIFFCVQLPIRHMAFYHVYFINPVE